LETHAVSEVELLDLHALEHCDVAWVSGGGGKMLGEMKKVPGKVLQVRPWAIGFEYIEYAQVMIATRAN